MNKFFGLTDFMLVSSVPKVFLPPQLGSSSGLFWALPSLFYDSLELLWEWTPRCSKIFCTLPYSGFYYYFVMCWLRRSILSDCNWTRTHNHFVHKQTLYHLAKLPKWLSCCEYLSVRCIWLYVLVMSHTPFKNYCFHLYIENFNTIL